MGWEEEVRKGRASGRVYCGYDGKMRGTGSLRCVKMVPPIDTAALGR